MKKLPVRAAVRRFPDRAWDRVRTMGVALGMTALLSFAGAALGAVLVVVDVVVEAPLGVGLTAGAGIGMLLGMVFGGLEARDTWVRRRQPVVGDALNSFEALDAQMDRLEARRDEDPELVNEVLAGVGELRASLVEACAEFERERGGLTPEQCAEIQEMVRAEFRRAGALLEDAEVDLGAQEKLRQKGVKKTREITMMVNGDRVERLRGDLGARRGALAELGEFGA